MATQPMDGRQISVEEYLSTGYEPDCEYDDGAVQERSLGEFEHSFLQILLGTIFTNNMDNWGVFGLTEQRVQTGARRFLVPDVCVLRVGSPREKVLTHPPLIVIEIMSPEDTLRWVAAKALEYLEFGVEHVWVIDPEKSVVYRGGETGLLLVPSGEFAVLGSPIQVSAAELFEKLDRI